MFHGLEFSKLSNFPGVRLSRRAEKLLKQERIKSALLPHVCRESLRIVVADFIRLGKNHLGCPRSSVPDEMEFEQVPFLRQGIVSLWY